MGGLAWLNNVVYAAVGVTCRGQQMSSVWSLYVRTCAHQSEKHCLLEMCRYETSGAYLGWAFFLVAYLLEATVIFAGVFFCAFVYEYSWSSVYSWSLSPLWLYSSWVLFCRAGVVLHVFVTSSPLKNDLTLNGFYILILGFGAGVAYLGYFNCW